MDIKKRNRRLTVTEDNKYMILRNYYGTYIHENLKNEEKMQSAIFRVFEAAKPSSGRKLNVDPVHAFDPFTDSIMDYASIIGSKLSKPWQKYNRFISIQIPDCPNDCWHCYLPKELYIGAESNEKRSEPFTAKEIIKRFLEQRSSDEKQGVESNVLRISGGEPFLLPGLISACLKIIKDAGLDDEIFVWTETNLEPFVEIRGKSFMDEPENSEELIKIGQFKNVVVHPCFHGLSRSEFNTITGRQYNITLEQQLTALKKLVDADIDIYPTIGSNVCSPKNLEVFYNGLKDIDKNLPFKVALIKYDCGYPPVIPRLKEKKRKPRLYAHCAALRIWNRLLIQDFGVGYGIIPRHFVALNKNTTIELKVQEKGKIEYLPEISYFFKASYRQLYHRELLDLLAYPKGHICTIDYDKKWVQDDLFAHIRALPELYEGQMAIWSYFDKDKREILPLRECKIVSLKSIDDLVSVTMKFGDYICMEMEGIDKKKGRAIPGKVTSEMTKYFGEKMLPPGGKYWLLGEPFYKSEKQIINCCRRANTSYVFENFPVKIDLGSDFNSFRKIVPDLASPSSMQDSVFYKIDTIGVTQNNEQQETIYEVTGGNSFEIDISYYLPNYEKFSEGEYEQRTIYCDISSRMIKIVGPNKIICSKYGSERLKFRTKKTNKDEEVALVFYSKFNEFKAAKVVLKIKIKSTPKRDALFSLGAAVVFFIGTLSSASLASSYSDKTLSNSMWTNLVWMILSLSCFYVVFWLNLKGYKGKAS